MITAIEVPPEVQDPRLKAIVKAKDGRRYLVFDPTNEHTPVGNLPSYLQGSYGTLAAGSSSQVIALPVLAPDANASEQKGSFTLSADGTLTGAVDTSHSGPDGAEFRLFLKQTDEKERREIWENYVAHDSSRSRPRCVRLHPTESPRQAARSFTTRSPLISMPIRPGLCCLSVLAWSVPTLCPLTTKRARFPST